MEEKVQEMLNKINEKYNDFEIKSVDLSLLRKLENLANKIAFNSLLRELCFKYSFLFFINKNLFIVSELYLFIDKNERSVEYEVGKIYEPIPFHLLGHQLYFMFDASFYPEKTPYVGDTIDIFEKVLQKEKLVGYYSERYRHYVLPFNAEVLHYSVL
jgi:hypothetical protein